MHSLNEIRAIEAGRDFECNGLFMSVMQPFGFGKLYGLQNLSS